jgi:O-antigen ligase
LLWIAMLAVGIAPESIAFVVLLVTSAVRMVVDPRAWDGYFQKARVLLPFAVFCMWAMCAATWSSHEFLGSLKNAPLRPLFGLLAVVSAVRTPWPALLALAGSSTVMLAIAAVKVLANPALYGRYSEGFPGIVNSYSATCLITGALITGAISAIIALQQRRFAAMACIPVIIAAIVLRATGSRIGAVAALIGTVISVASLMLSKRARRWRLVVALALIAAVGGGLFVKSAASARLLPILHGTPDPQLKNQPVDETAAFLTRIAGIRGQIWFVSLSLAGQRPIWGWGTTSWKHIYPAEVKRLEPMLGLKNPRDTRELSALPHAHNSFLHVLVEQGAIGLILLCWLLAECWDVSSAVHDRFLRGVLLGLLGVWISNSTSRGIVKEVVPMVYLGLIAVTARVATPLINPQSPKP